MKISIGQRHRASAIARRVKMERAGIRHRPWQGGVWNKRAGRQDPGRRSGWGIKRFHVQVDIKKPELIFEGLYRPPGKEGVREKLEEPHKFKGSSRGSIGVDYLIKTLIFNFEGLSRGPLKLLLYYTSEIRTIMQ